MSKPREFFICDETDNSGYSVRDWSEKEAKRQFGSCNVFHVIEYSAYETLTAKVKRYEDAMVHIHKMGCAYKGNLTGCPACYICNEFPEFNEMNKRDRSEHGNN